MRMRRAAAKRRAMMRATFFTPFVAACGAVALLAGVACTGGAGDGPNATISPPPYIATPSPLPQLEIVPPSVAFTSASAAPQQVIIVPLDPSDAEVSVVHETCTRAHIATLAPSPSPSYNPSSPSTSFGYDVTPGRKDGTCTYTFRDAVSTATGVLKVQNQSNAAIRPR
jgi:hypothetical protein